MIEPRKEVVEADAIRNAEGNIGPRETEGRLDRGHRAGHAREGFLESWEISSAPSRGGTAERRKRSEAEVGEKSERPDSSADEGEPGRWDPSEPSGAHWIRIHQTRTITLTWAASLDVRSWLGAAVGYPLSRTAVSQCRRPPGVRSNEDAHPT